MSTYVYYYFVFSKHGVVVSGKNNLYVAGGEYPDGKVSNRFWRYDSMLDVWQEMAPMLTPRSELGNLLLRKLCFMYVSIRKC